MFDPIQFIVDFQRRSLQGRIEEQLRYGCSIQTSITQTIENLFIGAIDKAHHPKNKAYYRIWLWREGWTTKEIAEWNHEKERTTRQWIYTARKRGINLQRNILLTKNEAKPTINNQRDVIKLDDKGRPLKSTQYYIGQRRRKARHEIKHLVSMCASCKTKLCEIDGKLCSLAQKTWEYIDHNSHWTPGFEENDLEQSKEIQTELGD
jgi:hypothetical protein